MSSVLSALLSLLSHPTLVAITTTVSIVLFVTSVAGIPWLVSRLPADYFKRGDPLLHSVRQPSLRVALRIAKNILGVVLLAAGLAMLVLPGQGVLTLIVALVLIDFPGKRELERRLVSRPRVLRTLNRLRRRSGREPLVID
jgi:hypothetical protein